MMPRPMYGPSPWMMPSPPPVRRAREMQYGPLPPWMMMRQPLPLPPRRRARDMMMMNGPSPWVPATILGIILIIAVMPYMSLPQSAAVYQKPVYQKSSSFSLPLLLIPVVLFILAQWLSGSPWRPFRPTAGDRSLYSNRSFPPPGCKPRMMMPWQQQQQQTGWPWARAASAVGPGGYGRYRAVPPNNMYASANINENWTSGIWRSFMDYSGHWLLILLGFALFAIVSSG